MITNTELINWAKELSEKEAYRESWSFQRVLRRALALQDDGYFESAMGWDGLLACTQPNAHKAAVMSMQLKTWGK